MSDPVLTSRTKALWKSADAVCFDVDSTVITMEPLDQLAAFCGAGEEVAQFTLKAMGGGLAFRDALRVRLNIIKPSYEQIKKFQRQHAPEAILTPGIKELIHALRARGTSVYLVSGGFRYFVAPVAQFLGLPNECVFCNELQFNSDGTYLGFDESLPTSESGGKGKVISSLKNKHQTVVMVGDGITDLESCPPADSFIGFGGNVVRQKVKELAPWYVYSFQELKDEL
ncbi:hypothetical protein EMCRGX_G024442 [Ephydatia muelleri]|eukprot:Em0015g627a